MAIFGRGAGIFLLGFLAVACPSARAQDTAPFSVAIAAAATGEQAVTDGGGLGGLLVGRLSDDARWKIVERPRMADLERELALSPGGWSDAAASVRQGRLLHADVVLVCRVHANGDNVSEARIDAVDSFRAEILASQTVTIGGHPNGAWLQSPPAEDLEVIASASQRVLAAASDRLQEVRGEPVVFPLFFRGSGASDSLGVSFRAFLEADAKVRNMRSLRQPQFGGAQDEGLLATAGMVDFSAQSWVQVADLFVWGEFAAPTGNSIILRMWSWAGAGKPHSQAFLGNAANLESLARQAGDFMMGELAQKETPTAESRSLVAASLIEAARKVGLPRFDPQTGAPDSMPRLRSVIQLVDAAAFFVPENHEIQELRNSLAVKAASGSGATPDAGLSVDASRSPFALLEGHRQGIFLASVPTPTPTPTADPYEPTPPEGSVAAGNPAWYIQPIIEPNPDPESKARTVQLCDLIERGSLDEFKAMMLSGADPVAGGDSRGPALAFAAFSHKWAFADIMLKQPVDLGRKISTANDRSMTVGGYVLYHALAFRRPDIAHRMLNAGVHPEDAPRFAPWGSLVKVSILSGDSELTRHFISYRVKPAPNQGLLNTCVEVKNLGALNYLVPYVKAFYPPTGPGDASDELSVALLLAVKAQWTQGVRILVNNGAGTLARDRDGKSVQDYAAANPEIAGIVSRPRGAPDDPSDGAKVVAAIQRNDPLLGTWAISEAVLGYRDSNGWTVLHHACKEKRVAFARRLIAANAPLNVLGKDGKTALTLAVGSGDIDLVSALIAAGADVDLEGTQDLAIAPLFLAAQQTNLGLVRILLQGRADPNERTSDHATPLLAAAMHAGSIPVLTALLEAGASLIATNSKGEGVLEASIVSDDPAVIQFFVDHGAKWLEPYQGYNALVEAAQLGKRESVRKLLALGIYSPDALAAARDPAIRELLEEKGSENGDSTAGDAKLWPAICADIQNGRAKAEAFLGNGGNVNYVHSTISLHFWTPLSLSLKFSNFELARFLLAQGANPNVSRVDLYGELLGHGESDSLGKQGLRDQDVADAVRMLLDAGYGPPVPGYVVIAAGNGWPRTVELFLERGVSKDEVIRSLGETTPQYMSDEKRARIMRMLQ